MVSPGSCNQDTHSKDETASAHTPTTDRSTLLQGLSLHTENP